MSPGAAHPASQTGKTEGLSAEYIWNRVLRLNQTHTFPRAPTGRSVSLHAGLHHPIKNRHPNVVLKAHQRILKCSDVFRSASTVVAISLYRRFLLADGWERLFCILDSDWLSSRRVSLAIKRSEPSQAPGTEVNHPRKMLRV